MNNSFAIVIDCWVFVVIINHSMTNLHDNSWVLIAGEMRLLDMFHSNNLHIFNLWVVNVIVCAKHTDKHIWNVPCTYTLFITTKNVTNSCTNNTNSSKADLKLINNHSLQPQKVSKYLNFPKINSFLKSRHHLFTTDCQNLCFFGTWNNPINLLYMP